MKRSKLSEVLNVIIAIYTALYSICEIAIIVCVFIGQIDVINFFSITATLTINLFLLLCLNSSTNKINNLEKILLEKNLIEENDLQDKNSNSKEDTEMNIEEIENAENIDVPICKKCGFQIFQGDDVCLNCGAKIEVEKYKDQK